MKFVLMAWGSWKYFVSLASIIIVITLIILSLGGNSSRVKYYGPPMPDAIFEEMTTIQAIDGMSNKVIQIDDSWLGVRVTVSSVNNASVNVYMYSPNGQQIVSLERDLNSTTRQVAQIASFNPVNIDGSIVGNWNMNYIIEGGSAIIKIEKVISFGTP